MKIHEYQAKQLLRNYGAAVPEGGVAFTPDEAADIAARLHTNRVVVKAQIHAGGRGKAGGVKVVSNVNEARTTARKLLGSVLVTAQTGPAGKTVQKLLIEEGCEIAGETYLSFTIDPAYARVVMIASGGRRNGNRAYCSNIAGNDRQGSDTSANRIEVLSKPARRRENRDFAKSLRIHLFGWRTRYTARL